MAEFPKDFVWGAATAAYQIEGGAAEDGKGPSIWDVFSHTPGCTARGETGDVACDSYHRWREDVALLKSMHLKAYRFSVAWTRIAPTGGTDWNEKGFAYYDALVDALLEAGIEPYVTLYHWDLPQALEEKGGWRSEDTARAFAVYAAKMAEHFKGRVHQWFTFNEPACIVKTENGLSCTDKIYRDGKVHDADRIDFLASYLEKLAEGIRAGADVRGYFHWSLLDNYEWHSGYGERFGLVYMDYAAGRRIPKDSAAWYGRVATSNGQLLD